MTTAVCERDPETETVAVAVRRTITVLDQPDRSITWQSDRPEDVARARALFGALVGKGYFAYVDTPRQPDGTTAELITRFTEDTDIALLPMLVGG